MTGRGGLLHLITTLLYTVKISAPRRQETPALEKDGHVVVLVSQSGGPSQNTSVMKMESTIGTQVSALGKSSKDAVSNGNFARDA
ncbi:hypothetical protein AZE42_11273 [Rhizopogon vesiculosus]|uniref:Uncharacterized protein n=1 Tax=Rhizopogon vesiculosus TaxID=180088 RepID=A0A1J8QMD5_9AGAM|nr:hypothetical protein AZE42_11273 [Rhizopogon vesiculosus]